MNLPTTHKTCRKCGILLTISHFDVDHANCQVRPTVYDPICRNCRAIARRIAAIIKNVGAEGDHFAF